MGIIDTWKNFGSEKEIDLVELKNILSDLRDIGYLIKFNTKKHFYDPILTLHFTQKQGKHGTGPNTQYDVTRVDQNIKDSGELVLMFEEAVDRIEDTFGLELYDDNRGTNRFCKHQSFLKGVEVGTLGFRGGNPGRSDDMWPLTTLKYGPGDNTTILSSWIRMPGHLHLTMTFKLKGK